MKIKYFKQMLLQFKKQNSIQEKRDFLKQLRKEQEESRKKNVELRK